MSVAHDITRAKRGDWTGQQGLIPGPGHSADDRSMSIRDTADGADVILHSFAGDDWKPFKDQIRAEGLLPDRQSRERASAATSYVYRDADGRPVLRVVRKAGAKGFYQQHAGLNGEWITGLNGTDPLPYRLPELIAAYPDAPVYICEGEKDADNLAALGEVTTTNPGGAGKWPDSFARYLAGRECVVLVDNDQAGRKHAADVMAKLNRAGVDCVKLELPGLPDKGDVSDWIAMGGTAVDLARLTTEAFAAPIGESAGAKAAKVTATGPLDWRTYTFRADELDAMEFPPLNFPVPGLLPEGLTLIAGPPKFGKSFLALDLALSIASGGVAVGSVPVKQGDVLYVALEDGKRRLKDRMAKMLPGQQKPSRLTYATDWRRIGDGCEDLLRGWLDAHPDARLVILDTWVHIKPATTGRASAYDEDAAGVKPLHNITRDYPGVAVMVIHHVRKMDAEDVFDTISGTNGLTGIADTLMVLARHGEAAKLCTRGRDIDGYEKAMNRDRVTGGWIMAGDARELAKTNERQAMLDEMKEIGEPVTPTVLAGALGKKRDNINHLLRRLVKDGLVTRGEKGKYSLGDPFTTFTPFTQVEDDEDKDSERSERSE